MKNSKYQRPNTKYQEEKSNAQVPDMIYKGRNFRLVFSCGIYFSHFFDSIGFVYNTKIKKAFCTLVFGIWNLRFGSYNHSLLRIINKNH